MFRIETVSSIDHRNIKSESMSIEYLIERHSIYTRWTKAAAVRNCDCGSWHHQVWLNPPHLRVSMYSGQPLRSTAGVGTLWPLRSSTEASQEAAQRSNPPPPCASPDHETLVGRPESGSNVPLESSRIHAEHLSDARTQNAWTQTPVKQESDASSPAPVCPSIANTNGHPRNPSAEIKIEQADRPEDFGANYSVALPIGQNNTSRQNHGEFRGGSVNAQPQPTIQPNEENEDLSAFLPLGVLNQSTDAEKYSAELSVLEGHRWIRTRVKNDNLRIYVDPKLTRRNNVQKSIKKLRAALKVLISTIDPSTESWEGQRNAIAPDSSKEDEDESLWYIFNTLQDPDPQPDAVKDKWSQQAMLDLLSDDDFSDFGLKTRLHPYQRRSAAAIVQREVQPAHVLDPRLQTYRTPTGQEYYYDREDVCISLEKTLYSEACGGTISYSY